MRASARFSAMVLLPLPTPLPTDSRMIEEMAWLSQIFVHRRRWRSYRPERRYRAYRPDRPDRPDWLDRAYGAPGTGTVTVVELSNNATIATAICPPGMHAISGGARTLRVNGSGANAAANLQGSYPSNAAGVASRSGDTNPQAWTAIFITADPNKRCFRDLRTGLSSSRSWKRRHVPWPFAGGPRDADAVFEGGARGLFVVGALGQVRRRSQRAPWRRSASMPPARRAGGRAWRASARRRGRRPGS